MDIEITEESLEDLEEHSSIAIAFEVERVLEVSPLEGGLGGFALSERHVDVPYVKDYDAIEGGGPARWRERFDISCWGVIAARADGRRVGGAVMATDTPGLHMLRGRKDLAVLWDLRVAPDTRRQGVGAALVRAAEIWARARGCRHLVVETQNVNVPACRFYAAQGFVLGTADRFAYPDFPEEIQLLWCKDLARQ